MRKRLPPHLPLSALITGLLAAPALAGTPLLERPAGASQGVVQAFPAVLPAAVEEEMRRLARGEPLNAHGMVGVRRRMAVEMEARLAVMAALQRGASGRR